MNKTTLKEVMQALIDGKEVHNGFGWFSLGENDTQMQVDVGRMVYQIREKAKPHHHAEIIAKWIENPSAYQMQVKEIGSHAWVFTAYPYWHERCSYRLVDAKNLIEIKAESKAQGEQ